MARRPQATELPSMSGLDRARGDIGRQLTQSLREAIRAGNLKPGDLLPSSRQLAKALDIARGTVLEAYAQLTAEGCVDAQPRAGTRVAAGLDKQQVAGHAARKPATDIAPASLPAAAVAFAQVAEQFKALPPVPFAVSVPSGPAAPDDTWRRLGNRLRARGKGAPSGYDDPQGVPALREAVADYVRRSRAVQCDAGQIIITNGTQQGLYLACQILLGADDVAWVEDPGYWGITKILESTGRPERMVRVAVDDAGIDVDAGIAMARQARVAFVTPSHQYPLGMPMSMGRRNALLAWARQHGSWIVEDDYDSELRYAGHPFPSLQGLAPDRVVYLGTFSKILFASLRLGYAIVPKALVPAFRGARLLMDRHSPSADQHVLAAFITEGHLDRHIRRIRGVYSDRRAQLIGMLERSIPRDLGWLQPSDQGMHLLLWLAQGIDDVVLASRAMAAGVAVRPVSPMYAPGNGRAGLILGLGGFSDEQMRAAVVSLAGIMAEMRKP
nr:PLP-dependent aminotransferase family protein [uncultured Duganella sp.]